VVKASQKFRRHLEFPPIQRRSNARSRPGLNRRAARPNLAGVARSQRSPFRLRTAAATSSPRFVMPISLRRLRPVNRPERVPAWGLGANLVLVAFYRRGADTIIAMGAIYEAIFKNGDRGARSRTETYLQEQMMNANRDIRVCSRGLPRPCCIAMSRDLVHARPHHRPFKRPEMVAVEKSLASHHLPNRSNPIAKRYSRWIEAHSRKPVSPQLIPLLGGLSTHRSPSGGNLKKCPH
jgi:hypothetical protein